MIPTWAQLAYLAAAVCFVLALKGLSSPKTARAGNLLGSVAALAAMIITFVVYDLDNFGWILGAIVVGCAIGIPAARLVAMTAMPQLVALFNGVGGGAAGLVAYLELADAETIFPLAAAVLTVPVGAIAFSGSVVTFLKLQELITTRPVTPPGGPIFFSIGLVAALVLAGLLYAGDGTDVWLGAILGAIALVVGVLLVLPVGGADVPVAISLLNAATGLAVAAGGYVLGNALLLIGGTLVGASGTILTRLMAQAMGRSVSSILFGAFRGGSTAGGGVVADRPVRSAGVDDIAIMLAYAQKVLIVPGYGLAVAQAQHTIHELAEHLESRGIEVDYAIHAVAGRMPGHMNVLLAEANVPYQKLLEMETANGQLRNTDVALVVGANDVVNPAARNSPGSPIYGMPILDVDQARAVVFLKRSMRPGFAGIENELLYDPKTTLLFGDAKESLTGLVSAVKAL
ncbi:NAD(P)(+) transhydrogenase (Re/Si-specific) subunit beta [Actinobacteria bacterium YIM 96077]|uniref:NAD(P) transhydrogenase subunit beta n=1 Tax=Phytoactinopolyspora halophila TaxID=1981511 RepID=A0A329QBV8_9ACTN|nr:NAD(P)(+) transhydrogenase (Re/Si-specific) subunit beta [Phytoactinopolyspora halophila]AYY11832.1 NAD(P)(+) transhydrogenase (Re/Si-specific) subunit beta [Actinobacteria bacterium YIM 96077]RAW09853.1 NAD(P)(+) transhydrogenase (Re/Si-specific) subunit beta [Phytoactinopolyspora halophila]